ncbi:hypothetical protein LEP1GSC132_4579 [Leptospira kirschneri str. 200803703]|nr:hypothetical protein LEP1GSC132_4579 [Leptospira kirschneri str. 200803703]
MIQYSTRHLQKALERYDYIQSKIYLYSSNIEDIDFQFLILTQNYIKRTNPISLTFQ